MGGVYNRSGLVLVGQTGEPVARRAAAVEQRRQLLAVQPLTFIDLAVQLETPQRTVYSYLRSLEDLGKAYRTDAVYKKGRKLWCADVAASTVAANRARAEHARRAAIGLARQVGVHRDLLVEALFGPAS